MYTDNVVKLVRISCCKFPVALDKARFNVGGYCEVCKMAVSYIDGILEKNATEAEIEEAVKKVCSFLPDAYKTEVNHRFSLFENVCNIILHQPCFNILIPSTVWPAGGTVWADANPAAASDARPRLCVHSKYKSTLTIVSFVEAIQS